MAATPGPSLQLSDIIHTASPSPVPVDGQASQQPGQGEAEPEPLAPADIADMRRRLVEMCFEPGKEWTEGTLYERELAEMVLRLTESALVDPTQLVQQAATISDLKAQRDYLARQREEERSLWDSQKDGWQRMAETLIAQRNKQLSSSPKDPDLEKKCSVYESDNRALRDKLHDTQQRLQALEAELNRLKPILLMQPFATAQSSLASIQHASSFLSSLPYPSAGNLGSSKQKSKKRKTEKRDPVSIPPQEEREPRPPEPPNRTSTSLEQPSVPSSFLQFQAAPAPNQQQPRFSGDHYRKPTTPVVGGPLTAPPTTLSFQLHPPGQAPATQPVPGPSSPVGQPQTAFAPLLRNGESSQTPSWSTVVITSRNGKGKAPSGIPTHPLSSDARSEHLLLAARRIGRERAGIVVGYLRTRRADLEAQMDHDLDNLNKDEHQHSSSSHHHHYHHHHHRSSTTMNGNASTSTTPTPRRSHASEKQARRDNADLVTSPHSGSGSRLAGSGSYSMQEKERPDTSKAAEGTRSHQPPSPGPSTPRPQHRRTHLSQSDNVGSGGQNTPLASLLDAARMMDSGRADHRDDSPATQTKSGTSEGTKSKGSTNTSTSNGRGRRRGAAAIEQAESPPAKRRRVNSTRSAAAAAAAASQRAVGKEPPAPQSREENDQEKEQARDREATKKKAVPRVMSALDVLADQAAAFSSTSSHRPVVSTRSRAKEKEVVPPPVPEKDDMDVVEEFLPPPTKAEKKGRAKAKPKAQSKAKEKEKEKLPAATKPRRAGRAPPRDRSTASSQSVQAENPRSRVIKPPAEPRMIVSPASRLSEAREDQLDQPMQEEVETTMNMRVQEAEEGNTSTKDDQPPVVVGVSTTPPRNEQPTASPVPASAGDFVADVGEPSTTLSASEDSTSVQGPSPSAPDKMDTDPDPVQPASPPEQLSRGDVILLEVIRPATSAQAPDLALQVQEHVIERERLLARLVGPESQAAVLPNKPPDGNAQADSSLNEEVQGRKGDTEKGDGAAESLSDEEKKLLSRNTRTPGNEALDQKDASTPVPREVDDGLAASHIHQDSTSPPDTGSGSSMGVPLNEEHTCATSTTPSTSSAEIRVANLPRDPKFGAANEDIDAEGDLDADGEEDAEGELDSEVEAPVISPSTSHHPTEPTSIATSGHNGGSSLAFPGATQ